MRLLLIAGATWLALRAPLLLVEGWLPVRNVGILVCGLFLAGKSLYDTLFYDRFHP